VHVCLPLLLTGSSPFLVSGATDSLDFRHQFRTAAINCAPLQAV
jgi:hypothetical protein